MQSVLQGNLASGLSATSGFHSEEPNAVPQDHDGSDTLTPANSVPSGDTRVTYRGKYAQVYGKGESERLCGEVFRSSGSSRNNFVLQTKWWVLPADPQSVLRPKDAPLAKVKESLERTKLDYIDIYTVHGHIHAQSTATVAKSLADRVEQKLCKCVAVANYGKDDMLTMRDKFARYEIPLAANQCEYSILCRESEVSGLLKACQDNGIVFESYSSLAQGRLSDKYTPENPPPARYRFSSCKMEDIEPTLGVVRQIAEKRNTSVASVAVHYNPVHKISPVVGVRNLQQAESNC